MAQFTLKSSCGPVTPQHLRQHICEHLSSIGIFAPKSYKGYWQGGHVADSIFFKIILISF